MTDLRVRADELEAVRTLCDLIEGVESVNAECDPTYPELDRK
jgi:hypothetical protein